MKKEVGAVLGIIITLLSAISSGLFTSSDDDVRCAEVYGWYLNKTYSMKEVNCTNVPLNKQNEFHLFKNDQVISEKGFRRRSSRCWIDFPMDTTHHIRVNKCDKRVVHLRPNHKKIFFASLDSAYIFSVSGRNGTKFSEEGLKKFISKWNTVKKDYYQSQNSPSPFTFFEARVVLYYKNRSRREFYIASSWVSERSDWTYRTKDGERFFTRKKS